MPSPRSAGSGRARRAGRPGRAPRSARPAAPGSGRCMIAWASPIRCGHALGVAADPVVAARRPGRPARAPPGCAAGARRPRARPAGRGSRAAPGAGQPLVEAEVLGQVADPPPAPRSPGRLTEDARLAGGRADQAEQDLDRGRLAGAVRAEEAEDLAGLDAQVRVVRAATLRPYSLRRPRVSIAGTAAARSAAVPRPLGGQRRLLAAPSTSSTGTVPADPVDAPVALPEHGPTRAPERSLSITAGAPRDGRLAASSTLSTGTGSGMRRAPVAEGAHLADRAGRQAGQPEQEVADLVERRRCPRRRRSAARTGRPCSARPRPRARSRTRAGPPPADRRPASTPSEPGRDLDLRVPDLLEVLAHLAPLELEAELGGRQDADARARAQVGWQRARVGLLDREADPSGSPRRPSRRLAARGRAPSAGRAPRRASRAARAG